MEGHILANVNDNHGMSFDVDETLYFEKGQGISEMLSISLEPDILVQSYNEYVQVRGLIILQGEYRKVIEDGEDTVAYNNQFAKYIEKVIDLVDGRASFSHRIPVEVSIPNYRVRNINDIMVVVDSFDYELPNQHILKVNSTLHIYGIDGTDYDSTTEENAVEVEHNTQEAEIISEEVEQNKSEEHKIINFSQDKNETKDTDEKKHSYSEEQDQHIGNEATEETQVVQGEIVTTQNVESVAEEKEIDIQLKESKQEEEEIEEDKKDVMFLTEFFSEEEEEVKYSKLKIHIIQEDDTIESIAKRYEIPATKLMQDNDLTNNQLEEGQLLNIGVHPNE